MPSFKKADVGKPLQAPVDDVWYRHGAKDFVFGGTIKLGGAAVNVELVVPIEFLRRLGANLNDPRIEGDGHALWHVRNPEREVPCWSCGPEGKRLAEGRSNAIEAELAPPKLPEGPR